MIKNYSAFTQPLNEAKIKPKIERSELKVGSRVLVNGDVDGINIDHQIGTIIFMRIYGRVLIEFDKSFNKLLHAGHKDIGKDKHCLYVPVVNIISIDDEFEKIIKKVGDEKKMKKDRLATEYKMGDIIVGIDKFVYGGGSGKPFELDSQVGVVYYEYTGYRDKEAGNKLYWVGFFDKFDTRLNHDGEGTPANNAGMYVDKLHMRKIEHDEIDNKLQKDIDKVKEAIKKFGEVYDLEEIVVVDGNYNGVEFKNQIGVVRESQKVGKLQFRYTIHFVERFSQSLYDVNYVIGEPNGYTVPGNLLRRATNEDKEPVKTKLKSLMEDIALFNHDYKVGDYVIARGRNMNYGYGIEMDGQIGIIYKINGSKPRDCMYVDFLNKFSEYLQRDGKHENTIYVQRGNLSPIEEKEAGEIKRKLENKEIMSFQSSKALSMLLGRIQIRIKTALTTLSYFDITDKSDTVTYLPLDRFKRLGPGDDPYKSKLRQPMKIGKFFRILDEKLTDKEVETYINSFRSNYEICITGVSDKLKLVSGEDIRFWYNGANYVEGGGSLNGSCMRGENKGPEMQMFVDNPDTIQMLVLLDTGKNKLLGRALVWKLVNPPGGVYMDYVYIRFDKDRDLFRMYASQKGWFSGELGNTPKNMVCALNTRNKYKMGVNALDHFDTFTLRQDNLLYRCGDSSLASMKNPYWESGEADKPKIETSGTTMSPEIKTEIKPIVEPVKFKVGDKVIYKKTGSVKNNKTGVVLELREDGKVVIRFQEEGLKLFTGKKFAALPNHIFLIPEEKKVAEMKTYEQFMKGEL